jgi:hypothetical protein
MKYLTYRTATVTKLTTYIIIAVMALFTLTACGTVAREQQVKQTAIHMVLLAQRAMTGLDRVGKEYGFKSTKPALNLPTDWRRRIENSTVIFGKAHAYMLTPKAALMAEFVKHADGHWYLVSPPDYVDYPGN